MDNQNNIGNSFLNTNIPPSNYTIASSSSENGFFDGIKNISLTTWIIIILILSFLGLNIFVYLAKGTQKITDIFKPIIDGIFAIYATITGQNIYITAEGAKDVLNKTTDVLDKGLTKAQDVAENVVEKTSPSILKTNEFNEERENRDIVRDTSLNRSQNQNQLENENYDFMADESSSSIQAGNQKSGWCYIGESRGTRTCAEVGVNDVCMSGDIFPTRDICVNPNLRK